MSSQTQKFQHNLDTFRTELLIVLDCSGSMYSIRAAMEESLTSVLHEQKTASGECLVSLLRFNTESHYAFVAKPIYEISDSDVRITPSGGTALYDAIGKIIKDEQVRVSALPNREKPDKIFVVIVTDGEENASKLYNREYISRLISSQEEDSWKFYYLGANQDAFKTAKSVGISKSNAVTYRTAGQGIKAMGRTVSDDIIRTRAGVARPVSFNGQEMDLQCLYQQNLDDLEKNKKR
jgi:uncharacterized protein YegL